MFFPFCKDSCFGSHHQPNSRARPIQFTDPGSSADVGYPNKLRKSRNLRKHITNQEIENVHREIENWRNHWFLDLAIRFLSFWIRFFNVLTFLGVFFYFLMFLNFWNPQVLGKPASDGRPMKLHGRVAKHSRKSRNLGKHIDKSRKWKSQSRNR